MTTGITVYPVDAVSGAPQYTGRMAREALGVLSAGATSSRPLGGRSGIRPGTGTCVTATSTTWTVTPHGGVLDLEAAAEAGPYLYAINANKTGAVTAADGTNARVDIVYLTLNDPAEGDGTTTPDVVPGYLAGTPAASPTAPATPARSMVLAQINVPKSGGGSPTVTMVAPFAVAAGAPVPVRSQAERDALSEYAGLKVLRLDQPYCREERWDGSGWYTEVFGEATVTTNATGDFSITTGLTSIATAELSNSNGGSATGNRQNITVAKNAPWSGGSLTGRVYVAESHSALASSVVGILWHAWGYS